MVAATWVADLRVMVLLEPSDIRRLPATAVVPRLRAFLMLVVPVVAPMVIDVPAWKALTVVAVVLSKATVVALVEIVALLRAIPPEPAWMVVVPVDAVEPSVTVLAPVPPVARLMVLAPVPPPTVNVPVPLESMVSARLVEVVMSVPIVPLRSIPFVAVPDV